MRTLWSIRLLTNMSCPQGQCKTGSLRYQWLPHAALVAVTWQSAYYLTSHLALASTMLFSPCGPRLFRSLICAHPDARLSITNTIHISILRISTQWRPSVLLLITWNRAPPTELVASQRPPVPCSVFSNTAAPLKFLAARWSASPPHPHLPR